VSKKPTQTIIPSGKKAPAIAAEVSIYDDRKAAWRVSKIQLAYPYGWHELDASGISRMKEKLAAFEGHVEGDFCSRCSR
jgi:hypothetical protein